MTITGVRYWITHNGDQPPSAVARINDGRLAERILAGASSWDPMPSLCRLVVDSLNMEWDEINASQAHAALVELGVDPAVLDEPFIQ